jgi:hypothetical protein
MLDAPDEDVPAPDTILQADEAFTRRYCDIEALAQKQHWRLRGHLKEEAVQETLAFTMKAFRSLAARGSDPEELLPSVVRFAAKRWYAEHRFAGKVHEHDALASKERRRAGHFVTPLPHSDDDKVAREVRDALRHRAADPAEEAITNLDWQEFLKSATPKQRGLVDGLQAGLNLTEIAEQQGVTKAAVSDMRNTMAKKWAARDGYNDPIGR